VFAVEIHQVNGTSSDISFDLYLHGRTSGGPVALEAVRLNATTLGLLWPLTAAEALLEAAPALPAGPWAPLVLPLQVAGEWIGVTVPTSSGTRFFRLAAP
jgi:hypothetical protein